MATTTVLTSTVTTTKSPPANTTTTMMTTTTTPPTTMTTDFETTVTDSTTSLTTLQERRAIYPVTIPTRDLYVTTAGLTVYKGTKFVLGNVASTAYSKLVYNDSRTTRLMFSGYYRHG